LEAEKATTSLWLKIAKEKEISDQQIITILMQYKGDIPVYIYQEKTKEKRKAEKKYWVDGSLELQQELKHLLGEVNVVAKDS
jgi:DNA polymerase-3 subunit alpha